MSDRHDRPAVSLQWQRLAGRAFANIDTPFLDTFRAAGPLNRFAAWNPYEPSTRYLLALLYSAARHAPDRFFEAYRALGETSIGAPPSIHYRGLAINADYLAAVDEFLFLDTHGALDHVTRVVEIGAGFGRTCHALLRLAPAIREYIIVDLPEMLALSRAYLARSLPDRLEHVRFVPHASTGSEITADLSINIDGFQEMPPATIEAYLQSIVSRSPRFYLKNPVGKFDPARVGLVLDAPQAADVFELGYCRQRIDIFDEAALEAQRHVFVDAYRPEGFSVAASEPMALLPYYQHVLYHRSG